MKPLRLAGLTGLLLLGALAQPASAQYCLTVVSVDSNGKLAGVPPLLDCKPDDKVVWVVDNGRTQPVKVTFDDFTIRGTTTKKDPLVSASHPMTAPPGISASTVKVKPRADFGSTLPYGGFKYAITVSTPSGTQLDYMDPDLDVTPPGSIIPPRGRGRGGR